MAKRRIAGCDVQRRAAVNNGDGRDIVVAHERAAANDVQPRWASRYWRTT